MIYDNNRLDIPNFKYIINIKFKIIMLTLLKKLDKVYNFIFPIPRVSAFFTNNNIFSEE